MMLSSGSTSSTTMSQQPMLQPQALPEYVEQYLIHNGLELYQPGQHENPEETVMAEEVAELPRAAVEDHQQTTSWLAKAETVVATASTSWS